jgi:transcriptional regulator with XRE-family HTH domain
MRPVDDLAIGRALRALRRRRLMRQVDLARLAGVSQQQISRIECGQLDGIPLTTIRAVFARLEADAVLTVRWRGGELDRLLDARHVALVGTVVTLLRRRGWEVLTEVTFSVYGERGSIDVLGWHRATRTLLVIEVKSEIASAEELLRRHDVKVRLAPRIGLERFGERPSVVARLLVVADGTSNRRRVQHLRPVLASAYPDRGRTVRSWLRAPSGSLAGIAFARVGGVGARRVGVKGRARRGPQPPAPGS